MQGMLVLMALLVLVGGYQSWRAPVGVQNDIVIETATARQMLQTANALGMLKAQGKPVLSLCPGLRPADSLPVPGLADTQEIHCTEYNGRIIVWTREVPGLASTLREYSRESRLLARFERGGVTTLVEPAPWSISLPASVSEGSLVYIN